MQIEKHTFVKTWDPGSQVVFVENLEITWNVPEIEYNDATLTYEM